MAVTATSTAILPTFQSYTPLTSTPFTTTALNKLYPPPSPLSIAHLTTKDIALYTNTLSHHPPLDPSSYASEEHAAYRRRTAALISSLPRHLLNPTKGPLARLPQAQLVALLHAAGASDALPSASPLCPLHARLNAQIVADALGALEMEAEDFMPAQLARAFDTSVTTTDSNANNASAAAISPALTAAALTLEDFTATFLPPAEFMHWFSRPPPQRWTHPQRGEAGCDACTLARVAADPEVLVALRASVLARMPDVVLRGEVRSPRLEWLEGWIWTWGKRGTGMLFESGRLAEELRGLGSSSTVYPADMGEDTDVDVDVGDADDAGETTNGGGGEGSGGDDEERTVWSGDSALSLVDAAWTTATMTTNMESWTTLDTPPVDAMKPARASSVLLPLSREQPDDGNGTRASSTRTPKASPRETEHRESMRTQTPASRYSSTTQASRNSQIGPGPSRDTETTDPRLSPLRGVAFKVTLQTPNRSCRPRVTRYSDPSTPPARPLPPIPGAAVKSV